MSRIDFKPGTMIYPLPAVLVSCGNLEDHVNLITVSWVGTLCTNPPICYISVRPERHSYELLTKHKEFVLNLTTESMAFQTDWCGVKSGSQFDKVKEMGLHLGKASVVKTPVILESPLSIECKLIDVKRLGSHDMFMAEVVNVQADEKYLNTETGKLELEKSGLLVYAHGEYYKMGEKLGHFGWSVKKK